MRIFMLSPHAGLRSPLPKITLTLSKALEDLGCDVVHASWGRRKEEEPLAQKLLTRPGDILSVWRIAAGGKFDALVVQTSHDRISLVRDVLLAVLVRPLLPCVVFHFHGGHSDWLLAPRRNLFKAGSRLLFRVSDGVLVDSSAQRRELEQFAPSAVFREVLIPFAPTRDRQNPSSPQNATPVILFAGRLTAKKGIFDTLEAAALLKDRLPFQLVIAGSGPESEMVDAKVNELNLREHVTLSGWLEASELADLYHSADVFVLPTCETEGFPTVIGEAMAAGLPLVATRNRGIIDHVEENINGLFVADHAPRELADSLERLLRDDALRANMSRANLEKVRMFAPPAVALQYLATLREIASRRKPSAITEE